jgi:carboxyl-terminal processing protease
MRTFVLLSLLLASSVQAGDPRFDAILDLVEKNFSEAIPRNELEDRALLAMLQDLDPYSAYMNAEEWAVFKSELEAQFGGIGVILRYDEEAKLPRIERLMLHSPAAAAGIRVDDHILTVDGQSLEGLPIERVIPILRGKPATTVELTLRRKGTDRNPTVRIVRQIIRTPSVRGVRRDAAGEPQYLLSQEKKIGYIHIMRFADDTVSEVEKALGSLSRQGMRGLVLDLRDSLGGKMRAALGVADLFLDFGRMLTVVSRKDGDEVFDAEPGVLTTVPVVLLINEKTVSASEILAGALIDNHRVMTIGQRTYGKGRVQVMYGLAEGQGGIKLSTGTFQRPSGKTIDRHDAKAGKGEAGIAPDPGLEMIVDEKESEAWADEANRLSGAVVMTEEEQKFRVPDRMLGCALEVLGTKMRR